MMEPPFPINHPFFEESAGILSPLGCELPTTAESRAEHPGNRVPDESIDILSRPRCLRIHAGLVKGDECSFCNINRSSRWV
jgi:hypothetical protein